MDATQLLDLYRTRRLRIATAESCTGGMIAAALTDIAGSSDVFERGFVTYSNEAKTQQVGVSADLIAHHGAVSVHVAREMAAGALKYSAADVAVAVTGIAGPSGGSEVKPVGLVYIAVARRDGDPAIERHQFHGDRAAIRQATAERALEMLAEAIA
ncbi:MAG TPA: CinA family protein [Dongiaceae bacterium]|nr:CinA family protein [Dongiaceae bacterium]